MPVDTETIPLQVWDPNAAGTEDNGSQMVVYQPPPPPGEDSDSMGFVA